MKKTFNMVIKITVLVLALAIIQLVLYLNNSKTSYLVVLIIALSALVILLGLCIYLYVENRQVIFEYNQNGLEIRLLNYEDYQIIRELLNATPLTNSLDEVKLLQEYEKETVDLVRSDFHYLVILDNKAEVIFYHKKGTNEVKFLNKSETLSNVKPILESLAKRYNKVVEFIE